MTPEPSDPYSQLVEIKLLWKLLARIEAICSTHPEEKIFGNTALSLIVGILSCDFSIERKKFYGPFWSIGWTKRFQAYTVSDPWPSCAGNVIEVEVWRVEAFDDIPSKGFTSYLLLWLEAQLIQFATTAAPALTLNCWLLVAELTFSNWIIMSLFN